MGSTSEADTQADSVGSTFVPTTATTAGSGSSSDTIDGSTSGIGGSTGPGSSSGIGFIEPGESTCGAELPPGVSAHCTECDPFAQDCPLGEKCSPWANDGGMAFNAYKCSPVAPDAQPPGAPCEVVGGPFSGIDNCDQTSMCWNADPDTWQGVCVSFCQGSETDLSCPDPEQACLFANHGALPVCLPTCDPIDPDGCPTGELCIPSGNQFVCVPEDAEISDVAACDPATICEAGTICAPPDLVADCDAEPCCTPWCDLSSPDVGLMCGPAATCQPYHEPGEAPEGLEHVGLCVAG